MSTNPVDAISAGPCPLCGSPTYPWMALPPPAGARDPVERTFDRCESCGAGIERAAQIEIRGELERHSRRAPNGSLAIETPNHASLQAVLGREGWAALPEIPGPLLLTPRALESLAERCGLTLERPRFPKLGPGQRWMWQTLLNGLTLHPNFIHEVRAGRLRPGTARGRLAFAVDCVVTVLAAPLVALVSFPLELLAALARRGGTIVAVAGEPNRGSQGSSPIRE